MGFKNTAPIYRFKVSLSEDDKPGDIWRIIDIRSDSTLQKFHNVIFEAFDRVEEHLWSFYFGKPNKDITLEYTAYVDKHSPFYSGAKPGSKVKLNSLPFKTTKEIHYLFDFGDEWWHRIEFLSVVDPVPGLRYPNIVEMHGESPPQYPPVGDDNDVSDSDKDMDAKLYELGIDQTKLSELMFLKLETDVTYKDIEDILNIRKSIWNVPSLVGYLYGVSSAPHMLMGSAFLPFILGTDPFKDVFEGNRIMSGMRALTNNIQIAILNNDPYYLRPEYSASKEDLIRLITDLRAEMNGFVAGFGIASNTQIADKKVTSSALSDLVMLDEELSDMLESDNGQTSLRLKKKTKFKNNSKRLEYLLNIAEDIVYTYIYLNNQITWKELNLKT